MPDGVPRPAIGSYVQRHVAAAAEAIGVDAHMSVTFWHAGRHAVAGGVHLRMRRRLARDAAELTATNPGDTTGAGVDRLDVQPDIA